MSLSNQLRQPATPPSYVKILGEFPKHNIAKAVGCAPAYVYQVFNGTRKPSKKLNQKLLDLASKIESEKSKYR